MEKAPRLPRVLKLDDERILQAADLTRREAKVLCFYHERLRLSRAHVTQLIKQLERDGFQPPELFHDLRKTVGRLEAQVNTALEIYNDQHVPSRWMRSVGVGRVQAASIYSCINVEKCHKVSSLFRYAGLDPTIEHLTKQQVGEIIQYYQALTGKKFVDENTMRRIAVDLNRSPDQITLVSGVGRYKNDIRWDEMYKYLLMERYNKKLKVMLFRYGLAIRRPAPKQWVPYNSIYKWRKAYEVAKNDRGDYAGLANYKFRTRMWNKGSAAYEAYSNGRLPLLHIDARARRFAIKIFLVHLHQIMFYERYGKMPEKPYVLASLAKEHEIICPNWPFAEQPAT